MDDKGTLLARIECNTVRSNLAEMVQDINRFVSRMDSTEDGFFVTYVLIVAIEDKEYLYVGQTSYVRRRLTDHLHSERDSASAMWRHLQNLDDSTKLNIVVHLWRDLTEFEAWVKYKHDGRVLLNKTIRNRISHV